MSDKNIKLTITLKHRNIRKNDQNFVERLRAILKGLFITRKSNQKSLGFKKKRSGFSFELSRSQGFSHKEVSNSLVLKTRFTISRSKLSHSKKRRNANFEKMAALTMANTDYVVFRRKHQELVFEKSVC